jgi:HSP20 family protein
MDLIKIRITDALDAVDREFERTIDAMFHLINPKFNLQQNTWRPAIDIYEHTDSLIVLVEIAGVDSENLHVEIDQRAVKVYGIRGDQALRGDARYRLAEIACGYFERTINLPVPVDTNQAEASYKDGLLQLKMAKRPLNRAYKIPITHV